MTSSVRTEVLSIRLTMAEPRSPLTLAQFAERFTNLRALLYVSGLIGAVPRFTGYAEVGPGKPPREDYAFHSEDLKQADEMADAFRVAEAKYQSPMEIVLYVAGGGTVIISGWSLYRVAVKALDLWDRVNESRATHAETNYKVSDSQKRQLANELIMDQIHMERHNRTIKISERLSDITHVKVPEVEQAIEALVEITAFEIEGAPDS